MRELLVDIVYTARQLWRARGFTVTAVLTLALGVGVNAAMFTLTYAILLKSLPVPEPARLIRYTFTHADSEIGLSGPLYDALRKRQAAATDLLAWNNTSVPLKQRGNTREVPVALMSGNGFAVLGLKPYLGRAFSPVDDVPGGGANGYQALLSYDYWRSEMQGDPAVIGRSLMLNGRAVTVIGILPRGFDGLEVGGRMDILLPLAFVEVIYPQEKPYRNARGNFWLTVMGRLLPGQTAATARANLRTILPAAYAEADPDKTFLQGLFKPFTVGIESGRAGRSFLRTAYTRPLLVLEMLSGLLLLLCSTNIGLLMLARASSRRREFALRSALGASRRRILAQVLLEVLLLVPPALAAGVAAGMGLARLLASMLDKVGEPVAIDTALNPAVLAFSATIAVATALAAGFVPALCSSRVAPAIDMRQGGYGASSKVNGGWILSAQAAISVTLLISALLLGSTFAHLYLEGSGFRGQGLVFAEVNAGTEKLAPAQAAQVADAALAAVRSAPGIEHAALLSIPPLRGFSSSNTYVAFDRRGAKHQDQTVWPEAVSTDYFQAVGTRILEGRALTAADTSDDKVCVLSRSAAEFFFPGEDALGRLIYSDDGKGKLDPKDARRVVGIAEDTRFLSLREHPDHMMYTPITRVYFSFGSFNLAVRSSTDALATAAIHNAVSRTAPDAALPEIYSYDDLLKQHLQKERMLILLSSSFAAIALVLIGVGLFGILMRAVTQRTREIGVRMALGAQRASLVGSILGSALKRMAWGVAAGSALAYAGSRLLRALLYQTSIVNPWTYLLAALLVLGIAACAAILPSSRTVSINPSEALKME